MFEWQGRVLNYALRNNNFPNKTTNYSNFLVKIKANVICGQLPNF